MRRENRDGGRPACETLEATSVEFLEADAEDVGVATHFVERDQAVIAIKGRVLDPLRREGPGQLLELPNEVNDLRALSVTHISRKGEPQQASDEFEDRRAHRGIAAPCLGHR